MHPPAFNNPLSRHFPANPANSPSLKCPTQPAISPTPRARSFQGRPTPMHLPRPQPFSRRHAPMPAPLHTPTPPSCLFCVNNSTPNLSLWPLNKVGGRLPSPTPLTPSSANPASITHQIRSPHLPATPAASIQVAPKPCVGPPLALGPRTWLPRTPAAIAPPPLAELALPPQPAALPGPGRLKGWSADRAAAAPSGGPEDPVPLAAPRGPAPRSGLAAGPAPAYPAPRLRRARLEAARGP